MSDCPPRFSLVRVAARELTGPEAESIKQHLSCCSLCQSVLSDINLHVASYQKRQDEHWKRLKEQIQKQPESQERPSAWRLRVFFPIAASALAMLLIVIYFSREKPGEEVSFKGSTSIQIVAKRGEEQFLVKPGDEIKPGDALRFILTVDRAGFCSIFSVTDQGRISPFYPREDPSVDSSPWRVPQPGRLALSGSIVMDDWAGKEYLVVVFSGSNFDRSSIHQLVRDRLQQKGSQPNRWERTGELEVLIIPINKTLGSVP